MHNLFRSVLPPSYIILAFHALKVLSCSIYFQSSQCHLSVNRRSVELKMSVGIADYQEVIEALHDPEVLLIDVREPPEIEESGSIPKSINIPCKNF